MSFESLGALQKKLNALSKEYQPILFYICICVSDKFCDTIRSFLPCLKIPYTAQHRISIFSVFSPKLRNSYKLHQKFTWVMYYICSYFYLWINVWYLIYECHSSRGMPMGASINWHGASVCMSWHPRFLAFA